MSEQATTEIQTLEINGVLCHSVVEKCEGCDRIKVIDGGKFCSSYP